MHLGNIFTALISWLSVKSKGGCWILRIEDLDPQRSRYEYARQTEDDLQWLGLPWDKGGLDGTQEGGPFRQSLRNDIYNTQLERLYRTGLTYPCTCTRADLRATQAPHSSDGRTIYTGKCRPASLPFYNNHNITFPHATRIFVPDTEILFNDLNYGVQRINPAQECGDFVLRRADGAWAYQFAVVADDALMGVTEVVRGADLLASAAQQIYLFNLLGFRPPQFMHVPLVCNREGVRLSKRDSSLSMESLRKRYTAGRIIGTLACLAGIIPEPDEVSPESLIPLFRASQLPRTATVTAPDSMANPL